MKAGGVYHIAFVTYVNELGKLAESEDLAKPEEQEEAKLATATAEEEQSDHFDNQPLAEDEVPEFVSAQEARVATYTTKIEAYVRRCVFYMQSQSNYVDAGKYRQECLTGMVQILPEWGKDKDYTMYDAMYKEWYGIAKDTIKLPAGPTFRDMSDDESPMEKAGSDDRFSDGDGEVPPQKRTSKCV